MNAGRREVLRLSAGAAVGALMSLSLACAPAYAKDPALLTLTPDHFKQTAVTLEDSVADSTTISTEPGFVEHTGPMRTVWHDEYLQGTIDRKTGQKALRLAVLVIYVGNIRSYDTATFSTPSGPRSVNAVESHRQVEFCATGACTYTERVAFPIDEQTLRQLASGNEAGKPALWHFQLVGKSGPNYKGELSSAEIAGFLAKVDEATNTVPAAKANATKTALQQDLGIQGIEIAATPETPNRAGILIVAVKSGSVAQKAGIITGDIVYECDGHAIATLAELQLAVSATTAKSKIALKLYRGMSTMTVTGQF